MNLLKALATVSSMTFVSRILDSSGTL